MPSTGRKKPSKATAAAEETPAVLTDEAQAGGVMNDLQRNYADLTQAQKRIAEAIVEDPEFVAFATVDKLSARLGVASSTIVRFAYRLGLNGYPELQDRVRDLVRSRMRGGESNASDDDLVAHMADTAISRSVLHDLDNARRTILDLDPIAVQQSVERLAGARQVFFSGGVASGMLAEYAALVLDRIRGNAVSIDRGHEGAAILSMTEEDVLVAFSFPPYASGTLKLVDAARKQRATVVGITDSPIAPLSQLADHRLTAHVSGIGPQNSLVAPMALVNVLLNGVAALTPGSGDRYRQIFHLMDEWDTFLLRGESDS